MEEVTLTVDGTPVYGRLYGPRKTRSGVVLVHGFSSCLLEFGDLPERLGDAGFAALAIDLRGHGLSGGERGASAPKSATVIHLRGLSAP